MPRVDERIDASWTGPTPKYETFAMLDKSVSRQELIVYFSHVVAQVIDAVCAERRAGDRRELTFPEDSPWNRDWDTISAFGMTETEVSLLLSDIDGDALRNMTNLALGIALDQVMAEFDPLFMVNVATSLLAIISKDGARYPVNPDDVEQGLI